MANPLSTKFDDSRLFAEFSPEEWKIIKPLLHKIVLEKGQFLFKDGSEAEELYFVIEGSLDVLKKGHCLASLGPGHWVGEIAALGDGTRTASVQATKKTVLMAFSLIQLKLATKGHPEIYSKIITSLSKNMADRLRISSKVALSSIQKQLELAKMRIAMGQFLCNILMALTLFFFIVKGIGVLDLKPKVSSVISIPLILFLSYFLYLIMKHSGYPLSTYGLTIKNWKRSVTESTTYTIFLLLILLLLKWTVIATVPMFRKVELFHLNNLLDKDLGTFHWLLITVGYALLAPVQELMARGCLQGSLMKFLVGKNRNLYAILLSNAIFSTLHLQLSLEIAIYVFFVGCFWGWLYARQGTIIGVSLSHIILGICGFNILGPLNLFY